MGEQLPEVGETIRYYVDDDNWIPAIVVRVIFWDLVDVRLDGSPRVKRDVRRVIDMLEAGSKAGRFERI